MNYRFKTDPRIVQVKDLEQSWGKPAWARFWEMRVGKGVGTVYEMDAYQQNGLASRFVVVCPKRVIPTWQTILPYHSHTDWRILTDYQNLPNDDRPTVLLLNYERIWVRKNGRVLLRPEIANWCPEFVVADEGQKIKNRTAARSKGMYLLGAMAKYRRVLSGTPDPNSYADYYGIFKFLDPTIFRTWTEFANEFLLLDWYNRVVAYRNLDRLTSLVHSISSRVRRADCLDIPDEEDITHAVVLPPKAKRIYDALAKQMFVELETGGSASAPIVLTKLLRLAQINGGFVNRDDGETEWLHDAKVEMLTDVLEEVLTDAGAKCVVFFRFRPEIGKVQSILERLHIPCCRLDGDHDETQKFQHDPKYRVLLAQISSGSLGLDFSVAETAIYYSWDFDAATYEQARSRIWRPGGKLTHVHLVVPRSIDETMLKTVKGKMRRSSVLLDNYWNIVRGEAA